MAGDIGEPHVDASQCASAVGMSIVQESNKVSDLSHIFLLFVKERKKYICNYISDLRIDDGVRLLDRCPVLLPFILCPHLVDVIMIGSQSLPIHFLMSISVIVSMKSSMKSTWNKYLEGYDNLLLVIWLAQGDTGIQGIQGVAGVKVLS